MNVQVIYAHPVETSYCSTLRSTVIGALASGGHRVDELDLYREGFDPALSASERLNYHDTTCNTESVSDYVDRLRAADGLVLVYPVWNFGFPAILKGYFDRVFLPGVSFVIEDGLVRPHQLNIRKVVAVTTYGGPRWRAFLMGDPPRRIVRRVLRLVMHRNASVNYLAHYDMNRSTPESRRRFIERVSSAVGRM